MNIPSIARIGKWLVLLGLYFWVTTLCAGAVFLPLSYSFAFDSDSFARFMSGLISVISCVTPFAVIGLLMGGMVLIFNVDKRREKQGSDDFKKDRLFFRYGHEFNKISLPVAVQPDWKDNEIVSLVNELRERIARQLTIRFASDKLEVVNPADIKDKELPDDCRSFLRVTYKTRRGSQVSHFIHYAIGGKYIVVHYSSLLRGKPRWHDIVDFVISGPVTIWGWGLDFFQNQFSVMSYISRFVNNSYDEMDLETFFMSSHLVMLDETRVFLQEKGLLTKELEQIIVNNINNSQNINVTGSSEVTIGKVLNTVQGVAQNIRRATMP